MGMAKWLDMLAHHAAVDSGGRELPQFVCLPILPLLPVDSDATIRKSRVAHSHISQWAEGSTTYPVSKAIELMTTAVHLGFGELVSCTMPLNKRKVIRMVKRPFSELQDGAKDLLQNHGILEEVYNASFSTPWRSGNSCWWYSYTWLRLLVLLF